MKAPENPPKTEEMFRELIEEDPNRLAEILRVCQEIAQPATYYHWDKLRFLSPPGGLSSREWWLAIKLARAGQFRLLPAKDCGGRAFKFGVTDTCLEQLHFVDVSAAGQIRMPEDGAANQDGRDQYIVHSLVEEAITSSQIEGAATTRLVAKEMIRTGRRPRTRDEQMILNNYHAMQKIRELRGEDLSVEMVLGLHRILTEDTLDDPSCAGRLRLPAERIEIVTQYNEVLHTPPPADQLARRLKDMVDFANGLSPDYYIHPVLRAVILHFWLAYDHPFVDGNGRCARALFYWSMLRQGYWLCEYITISQIINKARVQYGTSFLHSETDDNDLTYFILYHLDLLRSAIDELYRYIAAKTAEIRQAERLIRNAGGLNHRQLAFLAHAIRHPNLDYTIQGHQRSHNVVYQTARSDLMALVGPGLLVMRRVGRRYVFSAVPGLQEKLRKLSPGAV